MSAAFTLCKCFIRQVIANTPFVVKQQERSISIGVTASIGGAEANQDDADYITVVRNADWAMYTEVKNQAETTKCVK